MGNEDKKQIEEKSKTLAFLLRHDKTYAFLEHGYRDVNDLVTNHGFTKEELCEIVTTDDKGRYEFFDEQQLLVRARYGHSVPVDVELQEQSTSKNTNVNNTDKPFFIISSSVFSFYFPLMI